MRIKQSCECGTRTYHLNMIVGDRENLLLASCTDCGRITGSVGDGKGELYGADINRIEELGL